MANSFSNWNLLASVLRQIPSCPFKYRKSIGVTVNDFGQSEYGYTEWESGYGHVQPVSEEDEGIEGIDFTKKTVVVYIYGIKLTGTLRQHTADQILYAGDIYNVVQVDNWHDFDSYCKCICQLADNVDDEETEEKVQYTDEEQ